MVKKLAVFTTVVLTGFAALWGQSFDRSVSDARRHMQAACQAVQTIMKAEAPERPSLEKKAAAEAADALKLWSELAMTHAQTASQGYAGDPARAQRLEDIRVDIASMGREISAGEWRPASLSCAHACGLLAAMHEANGVTLAIDAMTVQRKKVGFTRGLLELAAPAAEDGATPAPMTLADCVKEALANNPALKADAARASASDYAADAARASRFPRIELASDYVYSDRPQRHVQPSYQGEVIRFDNDIAQAIVEVRVPLFSGGRLVARQRAAELAAAAGQFNLQSSRQDLILNVTAAYLAAAEQRNIMRAIDASLAALREQLKVAEAMKAVGRIAPLDLLKVEVRVAAVEQRRSKASRDGELIDVHLAALLGRDPRGPLPDVSGAPSLPPMDVQDMDALIVEALAQSPGLRALNQEAARRRAELAQIKAERWPSLDAFGRWTGRSVVSSAESPLPGFQDFLTAGVTLKLPLWTGGELASRLRQAQALWDEAVGRERAFELQVKERVQREAAALAEASDRVGVAEKAAGQALEAFEIERANYELGRAAVNDLLDAQAALLDAELALAQARHDVAYSIVALAWAAGRDLETWLITGK